jgi:hypothetical protein
MGNFVALQFSVALFVGMAAAMIVPTVRRSVPHWIEAAIWLGLIVTCWLAITNIQQASTRHLTEAAAWGADQIVNTSIGLMLASLVAWMADHRFVIANVVVTLVGADILALVLLRSYRKASGWRLRIKLGEWVELPLYRAPAPTPVPVPYAMDVWNRRAERAAAVLGTAILAWFVQMLIWTPNVVIPHARARQAQAVASGRIHAAARLESLRERAIRLQASARAWHTEHGPAIAALVARSGQALDRAVVGGADQVVNIRALLSAQSIGWYGPIVPAPAHIGPAREEEDELESDRLAS